MSRMSGMTAEAVLNATSIDDGNEQAAEVTVPGAKLGDFVLVSSSIDVADLSLVAQVTAADTVTFQLGNWTGGAINLEPATFRVKVIPYEVA